MAAVEGVLDRVLPATPPRRFVKGAGQNGPSGSGPCGPGTMVLSGVCAVGGILLTMQTVSHVIALPDLEKIALSCLASVFFVVLSSALLTYGPTRNLGRILVDRITHAPQNWEEETLRSFVETGTWLACAGLPPTPRATGPSPSWAPPSRAGSWFSLARWRRRAAAPSRRS